MTLCFLDSFKKQFGGRVECAYVDDMLTTTGAAMNHECSHTVRDWYKTSKSVKDIPVQIFNNDAMKGRFSFINSYGNMEELGNITGKFKDGQVIKTSLLSENAYNVHVFNKYRCSHYDSGYLKKKILSDKDSVCDFVQCGDLYKITIVDGKICVEFNYSSV